MSSKFFFDTYALVEIGKGNPNYLKFRENVGMVLTKLNLLEYSYFLIREKREKEIEEVFLHLSPFCVDYGDEVLVDAAKMKFHFVKEKLSFVDCIGYFLAKKHGVKFLTGDEKFKGKDNVEFV